MKASMDEFWKGGAVAKQLEMLAVKAKQSKQFR